MGERWDGISRPPNDAYRKGWDVVFGVVVYDDRNPPPSGDSQKWRPLPKRLSAAARSFYGNEAIELGFVLDGAVGDGITVSTTSGTVLSTTGYYRVVVGDYGAYVELTVEMLIDGSIKLRHQSEPIRELKYEWLVPLSATDDTKIYKQLKTVGYADYVVGRYYISVYDAVVE